MSAYCIVATLKFDFAIQPASGRFDILSDNK